MHGNTWIRSLVAPSIGTYVLSNARPGQMQSTISSCKAKYYISPHIKATTIPASIFPSTGYLVNNKAEALIFLKLQV